MMAKTLLFAAFLFVSLTSIAQDAIAYKGEKINALDTNNNQTGVWKMFDEEKGILISCEFQDGKLISNTNFYKDSKLIASYNNVDKLEIYKDSKTITCYFHRRENNSQTLLDANGKELDDETIRYYTQAAQAMPMFYGGTEKMYEFIGDNFDGKGEKGSIKVQFVIDTKGFTSAIKVVESNNPKLNDEAIRVVSILPRWQPAYQGGRFVKFSYVIPITIHKNK